MRATPIATLAMVAALGAGCSGLGSRAGGDDGSGSGNSDAGVSGCNVFVSFDHTTYVAGPTTTVRAIANATGAESDGVLVYTWTVEHDVATVPTTQASPDNSQVTFVASDAGVYHVHVDVGGNGSCPTGDTNLNVTAPGANDATYRIRFTTPGGEAPTQERTITIPGGADFAYGNAALDPGETASGAVLDASSQPVAAYLKLMPVTGPNTAVEAFTTAGGAFATTVVTALQNVLIVPTQAGYAPRLVAGWSPTSTLLSVDAGSTISGTVKDPSGAAVVGAAVQLELGTVPSTATLTDGGGNFTVNAELVSGVLVTVEVVPAAATGLPRLTASSSAFDFTKPLAIKYTAPTTLRDLRNVPIRRGGSAVAAGTAVNVVGTLSAIGSVTTGATVVTASGTVTIATTTTTGGVLPPTSVLAPAAPLAVVIDTGVGGALSVTAIDLTTSVPTAIDSAAPVATSGTAVDGSGNSLAGVDVVALPDTALALAAAQPLTTITAADGTFTLPLAAGGVYDLRFLDRQGRAAPLVIASTSGPANGISAVLPAALHISGVVTVHGLPAPIAGASVQVLCSACDGVELDRPIGEAATDDAGNFSIAVPDPGVATVRHRSSELDRVNAWATVARALLRSSPR